MTPDARAAARLRDVIAKRYGLVFEDAKLEFLGEVLAARAGARGTSREAYLAAVEAHLDREELAKLAESITVGETYFFRNFAQFRAFIEIVIPDRMKARGASRRLSFLSLGCSSGEEPYSIAMAVKGMVPEPDWEVSILAYDVNPAALARAKSGQFTPWALRETPPAMRDRWFRMNGRQATLDPTIRSAVRFEQRNLAELEPWALATFDAVFCRNVLMYLDPAVVTRVVAQVERALCPGGYLFLGHAETLRGISSNFHLRHTHETFYYRSRLPGEPAPQSTAAVAEQAPGDRRATPTPVPPAPGGESWQGAIEAASARIHALTQGAPAAAPASASRARSGAFGAALDLLGGEQFDRALEAVAEDQPGGPDPDVLLLRAVLLIHKGELTAAEAASRSVLAIDDLSASAHYALALCREAVGDAAGAVDHGQTAVYLDPTFALPRLHLGRIARRNGDLAAARRELGHALLLLAREDAARIILFGGGFGRDALTAACRAELRACEEGK